MTYARFDRSGLRDPWQINKVFKYIKKIKKKDKKKEMKKRKKEKKVNI